MRMFVRFLASLFLTGILAQPLYAQTAPDEAEIATYGGLLAAVAGGKLEAAKRLIAGGADLNATDGHGRTPLMIAGYRRDLAAAQLLIKAGADLGALDVQRYDLITSRRWPIMWRW